MDCTGYECSIRMELQGPPKRYKLLYNPVIPQLTIVISPINTIVTSLLVKPSYKST